MPHCMNSVPAFSQQFGNLDPPPILSNNPVETRILSIKPLTAYPNYGNPSGDADMLYTGNQGTWKMDLPPFIVGQEGLRGQLVISAVLDDHSSIPVDLYSATIVFNGNVVHNGRLPLEHGSPFGSMFDNWRELTFTVPLRRNNVVTIINTSSAGLDDWIALDWMELRLFVIYT